MLMRTLLSLAIIAGSIIVALSYRAPADVAPQARIDIDTSAANLTETRIVDYTFVFTEGDAADSTCLPASAGTSC